jgi:hypothetical protein
MQFLVVQSGNSSLGLLGVRHFNEAEASRFACEFVHNDAGRRNLAIRFKGLTEIRIGCSIRKVPNEYIHALSYYFTVAYFLYRAGHASDCNTPYLMKVIVSVYQIYKPNFVR